MGMFDYIKCEVPLPDGETMHELQTKDFECTMAVHTITKDGKLFLDLGHHIETPKDKLPYPDAEPGSFESFCGIITWVPNLVEQTTFHGWLNFYGHNPAGEWRDYKAKFTDGKLIKIVRVDGR